MTKPDDPEIVSVAHVGNSVQVTFKNDREAASFPARMLHSARDLANRMPDVEYRISNSSLEILENN